MKQKTKIIIAVLIVALFGLVGLGLWFFKSGQRVTWTTPSGEERGIAMPKIPGMEFVSEERGNCSYVARYVYTLFRDKNVVS